MIEKTTFSGTVKISRGRLLLTMLYLYGVWPVILLSLLLCATLLAGFLIDLRWGIVFLLITFILIPMTMTFLYFYHGLRPTTALNTLPHTFSFGNDSLILEVFNFEKNDGLPDDIDDMEAYTRDISEAEKCGILTHQPERETSYREDEGITILYRKEYHYNRVKHFYHDADHLIIMMREPDKGFLLVPYDAFPSQEYIKDLISRIKLK